MIHFVSISASLARVTVKEAVRSKVFVGLLAFAAALIVLSAILSNLAIGWPLRIVTDLSLAAIGLVSGILAIILAIGSTSRDMDRKTISFSLAKPVSRSTYVAGKFGGVLAAVLLNLVAMTICAAIVCFTHMHAEGPQFTVAAFLQASFLIALRATVITAVAVTFAVLVSPAVALMASAGIFVAAHLIADVRVLLEKADLGLLASILYRTLPDFSLLDGLAALVHGDPVITSATVPAILYALLYSAVALLLATIFFEKRDLG